MSTKDYIKPAIKLQVMEQQLMQDNMSKMSLHDEIGEGQLGKGADFDETEETGVPKTHSVWEE